MLEQNVYTPDAARELKALQEAETDSASKEADRYPWLTIYQKAGRKALLRPLTAFSAVSMPSMALTYTVQ